MRVLIVLLGLCLLSCSDEHSCEDCFPEEVERFIYYDFEIFDNKSLLLITAEIKDKRNPDFYGFSSRLKNDTIDGYYRYTGEFEVSAIMQNVTIGDTSFFRYHFRWAGGLHTYTPITDTIIKTR